jgi:hypothetical protein
MKGAIAPDHIPVNKYQLLVAGVIPLTITEVSGIEDELQTTELPDRTVASGGNRGPSEVEIVGDHLDPQHRRPGAHLGLLTNQRPRGWA